MARQQIIPPREWTRVDGVQGLEYWLRHDDPIDAAVTVSDSGLFTVDSLGGYEMRIRSAAHVGGP